MPTLHPAHEQPRHRSGSVVRAGTLLGAGLGGLLDNLLLPQNRVVALTAWALAILGVALLWRAWQVWGEPRPTPRLLGGLLMGAGGYAALDVALLHAALGVHHFPGAGDASELAAGVLCIVAGMRVSTMPNRAKRRARARGA